MAKQKSKGKRLSPRERRINELLGDLSFHWTFGQVLVTHTDSCSAKRGLDSECTCGAVELRRKLRREFGAPS